MDKDRCVSIETLSARFDVSVGTVHTIRNWRFARSLSRGCSEKIRKKDVLMTAERWLSWSIQMLRFLMLCWPAMKAGCTAMTQRQRDRIPSGSMLTLLTQEGQTEQIHPQTSDDPFFDTTDMIYMHWVPTGQTVNQEYYAELLREFSKRFRRKRPALFKSAQWDFHQDNAPLHNSILLTDYLSKMGFKTVPHPPYNPDIALRDFWLFPKLRGCRYERIEEMKEAVTKVIDMLTKEDLMGPSSSCWNGTTSALQPEEITSKRD